MKSYLSLIPISAKVRRRQNRMTILCIIISVFLVTAVFGLADMTIRMEKDRQIAKQGNWHIMLNSVPESDAELIRSRNDVAASSWYDVRNYDMTEGYLIEGTQTVVFGAEEAMLADIMDGIREGSYPETDEEIMLTENTKKRLGADIGSKVTVTAPSGSFEGVVSGFCSDTSLIQLNDVYGAFLSREGFERFYRSEGVTDAKPVYYIQFKAHTNCGKAIEEIKDQYGLKDENVSENAATMGLEGFSSNSYIVGLYGIAAVLFVLVLSAGVLMIAGSMNSNVAQRSRFFGMLRCIGASRKQIMRLVRLEALSWCVTAVPIGVIIGTASTSVICAALRYGVGGEFSDMPVFRVSVVGAVCGAAVGVLTVLIAAQSPARAASKVSPVAAVSGSAGDMKRVRRAANTKHMGIETALGIHHAVSMKKNLVLMTGSFALSIILFLGFSAILDWVHCALPALRPNEPDVLAVGADDSGDVYLNTIDKSMLDGISGQSGVKCAFGCMVMQRIPAQTDKDADEVNLVSYDDRQWDWAEEDAAEGDVSKARQDGNYVITIFSRDNPLSLGDKVKIYGTELEIAAVVPYGPFAYEPTLICSEAVFSRLTGETRYGMVSVQMEKSATEEDIDTLREFIGEDQLLSDQRQTNIDARNTYWMFSLLSYGFLGMIAVITVFNIMNSISMSVASRVRQYGAMRAVGMDGRQLTKMIAAEVLTYVLCGSATGLLLGLPLHRYVFGGFITAYFGDPWKVPVPYVLVIFVIVVLTTAAAVYAPSKRISEMSVTEAITEL